MLGGRDGNSGRSASLCGGTARLEPPLSTTALIFDRRQQPPASSKPVGL